MGKDNNPPSLHRYLYAYANPTVYIDPDGHEGLLGTFFGLERRDLSESENRMLRQVHQTGMKMTATGGALVAGAPVIVAGGSEAALLTRAGVQGTVQAGRAVISEVARYGVKGAVLGNPVASTVVATEATATTAAVVSGADTPVSAAEAAAARRVKNAAVRVVESSSSAGVRGVPQTTGALSAGSVGAARVPGSHVEQELLALPAPPQRLSLPAPETQLALPAPQKPAGLLPAPKYSTPEMPGEPIVSDMLPVGKRYFQAVAPGQRSPGRFMTEEPIPNLDFVRNELAVTPGFKPDVSGVRQVEVIRPLRAQTSTVGSQEFQGKVYPGGGSQVESLWYDRENPYLRFVDDEIPFVNGRKE